MKKKTKIIISILLCFVLLASGVPTAVYLIGGDYSSTSLPDGFDSMLESDAFDNTADVRIMSSNLLVHYASWGGLPAKPRAKRFVRLIESYSPDVICVQEMCDSWYRLLSRNLPSGYKILYPFSNAVLVRMTAIIYNSDVLTLIDSGNVKYSQGDNARLRRVVWGVFENKSTHSRFAVTDTHFDLLRDGREAELTEVMRTQAHELSDIADSIAAEYSCPVFAAGDYNSMENTPDTRPIDIPEIYDYLASRFTDAKFSCGNKICGDMQPWDELSYDHIFIKGDASVQTFALLSYSYLSDMSDHYPIFADIKLN